MEQELQESGQKTATELQQTSARAQSVNFMISKAEAEAQQKADDEMRKMGLLRDQAYKLEAKSQEEVEGFKLRTEQGEQDLKSKMYRYLSQFNARGDKAQQALAAEAQGILKDMATRQSLDEDKLASLMENFNGKMGPMISEMDDAAGQTKSSLQSLEQQGQKFAQGTVEEQ